MNRKHRAMTLVEVMTALLITSTIGAATTGVTVALFNAQAGTDEYTENVQAARMSLRQMNELIAAARLITEGDGTTMTLWAFDDDDPGVINAEELVRLRYDANSGTIQRIYLDLEDSMDEATRDALNVPMTLADAADWNQASGHLSMARIYVTPIATGVSSVTFRYDAAPPMARLVAIEATFGDDAQAATFRTASSLRAPAVEWIQYSNESPILDRPDGLISAIPHGVAGNVYE